MIELKELTIGYAQKNNTKVVASGINATLHSGRLTCLIGANGIGKSTLLRTLSAFQPPLSGEIFIDNESPIPLSTLSDKQLSRLIGVVLTEKPDVQNMTVFELVGLGRSPYTGFWGRLNEDDKEVVKESSWTIPRRWRCLRYSVIWPAKQERPSSFPPTTWNWLSKLQTNSGS